MSKWIRCTLGDLITFQRGFDLPKNKMQEGIFPVVGSNGIIGFHNTYTTDEPSITIGRSGNVGKPFVYYGKTWSHNTTLYVKDYKGNDSIFVFYLLKSLDLGSYAGGSAVPTLNRNHIHDMDIIVPNSVEEQRKIGVFLKKIDDKIELNNSINNNLENQLHLYYRMLFKENPKDNWKLGNLEDLGKIIGGGTPSKKVSQYYSCDGIPWITPKDLSKNQSKFIARGATDISEEGLNNSSAVLMPKGSVLFSSRAPIGYIAIAKNKLSTNQGFKSVIPYENFGTALVYCFLKDNLQIIDSLSSGSTFNEVSTKTMKNIPALIPDIETVSKFRNYADKVLKLQEQFEEQMFKLNTVKEILLIKLLSGKLDVSKIDL